MVTPPSMKAIMEMTTSLVFLAPTYSPWVAYLMPTVGGILYLVLKLSITFLGLNQTFELTHFSKRFQRKINKFKMKSERV